MEASAPKRRKTSPTTNVPGGSDANVSTSLDGSIRRPVRRQQPSFASPTKASLARSNPSISEQTRHLQPPNNAAPAASEIGSPTSENEDVSGLLEAQLEEKSETGRVPEESQRGLDDTTHLTFTGISQPKSPVRRAGGGLASKPRRTPNKPSPRPLPPPSAEEEELINPFRARRGLRRSPPPGVLPRVEPEEPELPPTPTRKGISDPSSVNTSPTGIHNTPSKRPRRSRILAERMKSSPLKQPPLQTPGLEKENVEGTLLFQDAKPPPQGDPKPRKRKRKSHPARKVQEADPLADKKALRDSLAAEVAQLAADLEVSSRENSRLFQLQQTRNSSGLSGPEDQDRVLDVLCRHLLPPEKEAPRDLAQEWLEAALNPISFLPFGQADPILPSLFANQQEHESEKSAPPVSHHPISMTAEEELPYLQVFTPLTFTSTIATAPRESQEEPGPLMQRHAISVLSTPPGLFAAKINMTVNTKSFSIAELSVPRLDPSAASELGPFIERIIEGGGNSALTRNITVMTWAMSEWVRLATRRAWFWCAVERNLGTTEGLAECAQTMRKGTRRKRGGRPPAADEDEVDNDDRPDNVDADKARFDKTELLPQLGRTSLDLELSSLDGVEGLLTARIQWRIEFDWTGEAQSKIGLLLGAPAKWHGHDKKRSLSNIPEIFDKLIQESKDPMEALRTVVALVIGDDRT